MDKKFCKKCNSFKLLSEFTKNAKTKDGLCLYCKDCFYENYSKKRYKQGLGRFTVFITDYKEYHKQYDLKNKAKKAARNKKYRQNPLKKLAMYLRSSIRTSLLKKNHIKKSKTESIIGCSFEEFKLYIESLWQPWMNWDNYGNPKDGVYELNKTWDLDHIIPISTGITEEKLLKLNHYSNLQPLCSYINRFV